MIASPIGFNMVLTKVDARHFNFRHWLCINVVHRWKSVVRFCFIFNVRSSLFQLWSTTLKQSWSDVEMLAGWVITKSTSNLLHMLVYKPHRFRTRNNHCETIAYKLGTLPTVLPHSIVIRNGRLCWRYEKQL